MRAHDESHRAWSDLPSELLELFLARLAFPDHFRFSAVCDRWRRVAADVLHRRPSSPCLLLPTAPSWSLFSLSSSFLYPLPLPLPPRSRLFGSSLGWLLASHKNAGNHLLNPLSGQSIQLPGASMVNNNEEWIYYFRKAILSSRPSPTSNDCLVVAIRQHYGLTFCRPGDKKWSVLDNNIRFHDIVFFEGDLYCLTNGEKVLVFEIFSGCSGPVCKKKNDLMVRRYDGDRTFYLVECGGELLVIVRYWVNSEEEGFCRRTVGFDVLRFEKGSGGWVGVRGLGDAMLFLGESCSGSFSEKEFCGSRFRGNCIYFMDDEFKNHVWHEFFLEDEKVRPFSPNDTQSLKAPLLLFMLDA